MFKFRMCFSQVSPILQEFAPHLPCILCYIVDAKFSPCCAAFVTLLVTLHTSCGHVQRTHVRKIRDNLKSLKSQCNQNFLDPLRKHFTTVFISIFFLRDQLLFRFRNNLVKVSQIKSSIQITMFAISPFTLRRVTKFFGKKRESSFRNYIKARA